jgi:two-component system, OmpR family, sensor histidine kinase KdpD
VARGQLRIYLGAAPGVGKTYAMLAEAQRRKIRGTDVVAGLVEAHGRRMTSAMAEGLETVPRRVLRYRDCTFTDMDLDAVLARHPQVALVDELAHTNVPGCRHGKRWEDVEELLDAGIDVITTLNIQHLESLNDVTRQVTGVEQREMLPDSVARRADQIELVDMTPEALRRRMVHGNVYPPDRIDAALTHYFRPGNLTALRELALLWLADRVEEGLQRYRVQHGIATVWETTERIVVAIAGEPDDEAVIRRAARIAARTPGSDLLAVHVQRADGTLATQSLDEQRALVTSLGGTFHTVPGDDVASTLLLFARAENVTQMVLGASRRGRLVTLLAGKSVPSLLARRAEQMDVHLVTRPGRGQRHGLAWSARRGRTRQTRAEAAALIRLASLVLAGHGSPAELLEELRTMFGLTATSLLERADADGWYVAASAGPRPPETPEADVSLPVSDQYLLAGRGRALSGAESRVLLSCAVHVVAGLTSLRRAEQEAAGVSMASAGLQSRLQTSELETYPRPADLDEVLTAALDDLGPTAPYQITLSLAADLPDAIADTSLLARALTTLLADAIQRSPASDSPTVTAAGVAPGAVEIRITDAGNGTAAGADGEQIGLAREIISAMGGKLASLHTPGEGRTVIVTLPAAIRSPATHRADGAAES